MCRSFLGRRTSQLNVSCLSWKSPAKLPAVVSQDRRLPALAKAGSERVEDAALAVFCKTPIASDCLTEFRNVLNTLQFIGEGCNSSTTDSDSVCLGSNPSSPASNFNDLEAIAGRKSSQKSTLGRPWEGP